MNRLVPRQDPRLGAPAHPLVASARAIAPVLRRNADAAERESRLTPEAARALREAGLFRLDVPRSLGGYDLPLTACVDVLAETALACPSSAWARRRPVGARTRPHPGRCADHRHVPPPPPGRLPQRPGRARRCEHPDRLRLPPPHAFRLRGRRGGGIVRGRPLLDRARVRMDVGHASTCLRQAVQLLLTVSGASSFSLASLIQRHWRDPKTSARHPTLNPGLAQEIYGRALVGDERPVSPMV